VDHLRGVLEITPAGSVCEAYGVIGELYVPEQVQLATTPDAAIAVLVGGEILEHRYHGFTTRVGRIRPAGVRIPRNAERVVSVDVAVEHEPVVVRMGDVAPELTER